MRGGFTLQVTNQNTLNIAISTNVNTSVHISGKVIGIGASCTITASSNNLYGDLDIALGVRADNGELDIRLLGRRPRGRPGERWAAMSAVQSEPLVGRCWVKTNRSLLAS